MQCVRDWWRNSSHCVQAAILVGLFQSMWSSLWFVVRKATDRNMWKHSIFTFTEVVDFQLLEAQVYAGPPFCFGFDVTFGFRSDGTVPIKVSGCHASRRKFLWWEPGRHWVKCKPDSWNSPEGFRTRSALWAKVDPLSKTPMEVDMTRNRNCNNMMTYHFCLSCPGWLQKGLLPIFKNTKKVRKKYNPKVQNQNCRVWKIQLVGFVFFCILVPDFQK